MRLGVQFAMVLFHPNHAEVQENHPYPAPQRRPELGVIGLVI